jgi:hypothetical protein
MRISHPPPRIAPDFLLACHDTLLAQRSGSRALDVAVATTLDVHSHHSLRYKNKIEREINMLPQFKGGGGRDAVIFVLLLALFLMASPLLAWWATPERPWYLPYLIWGGLILLVYLIRLRAHDDL